MVIVKPKQNKYCPNFNRYFPNLKKLRVKISCWYDRTPDYEFHKRGDYVRISDIEKQCFDKEMVMDCIDEVIRRAKSRPIKRKLYDLKFKLYNIENYINRQ